MASKKRNFILRIFRLPRHNPGILKAGGPLPKLKPERLHSMEVEATNLASAKQAARAKVAKRGLKVRSVSFGAHDDLVVLVEA